MTKLILAILCIGLVASYYEEPHMIFSLMAQNQLVHPIGFENRNMQLEDTNTGKTENEDTQTDKLSEGQPIMHLVNKLSGLLNKKRRDEWTQSENDYDSIIEASVWPDDIKDDPYYSLLPKKGIAVEKEGNKPGNIKEDEMRHFYGRFYNADKKQSYNKPFETNLLEALTRIINNLTTWTQAEVNCIKNPVNDCVQGLYQKARDIRFLFHLMGDLHQPLHCSTYVDDDIFKKEEGGDKGGMGFKINYKNKIKFPLHRLFDAVLFEFDENKFEVRKFEGGENSGLVYKDVEYKKQAVVKLKISDYEKLDEKGRGYLETYLNEIKEETIYIDDIETQIKYWIYESHNIAVKKVYTYIKHEGTIIDDDGFKNLKKIVIKHMVLGSYRLKLILEEIWKGFLNPINKKKRRKLR